MSSLSLRGSHGIPQTAAVGRPARVRSAGAGAGTASTGEVHGRREDDAARARVLPAVVVRIGAGRGGGHGGRGGGVRSARSVAASTILTVIVIAAAGVLNVVATAAGVVTASVLTVVGTAGVLAVTVPAAAAAAPVTGRVLLERFVDFSCFARIAVPLENHADAQYECMGARAPMIPTMPKVMPTPALFAKKPLEVGARCQIGRYGGRGTGGVREEVGPRTGTAEAHHTPRLVRIRIARR